MNKINKCKFLITGGAGFVAGHIAEKALVLGSEVAIIDILNSETTPVDEKIKNTHSDTESDKTNNEKNKKYNRRNSNSSRSSDKSITSNYDKRDNSLDIIRNDEDNYEVVLPYQRIVK